MQAAQVLAGYSLGGADLLRRAMGKKKPEEMAKQRAIFVKGCREKNHIPESKANQIFDLLEKFAGYGFNKSHAAAYAIVAYQTAYLKANYPVEFFCAMMTNDMADTAKLSQYINEARVFGIEVLGPDVNESQVHFAPGQQAKTAAASATPDGEANGNGAANSQVIRFGLAAIKGVGEVAVEAVLAAREKNGDFASLDSLCERVDSRSANRKVLESLIKSGACDCLGETRKSMFDRLDAVLSSAANTTDIRAGTQGGLLAILQEARPTRKRVESTAEEWPQHELLAHEKELLGFYVTGHPLTPYAPILQKYALANTAALAQLPNRSLTRVGGLIAAVQHGISKKSGKPYSIVTLEDLEGSVQILCMNENYDRYRELLVPNKAILVVGEVNTGDERPKIFPQEMMPLEDAPRKFTRQVQFRLNTAHLAPEQLEAVQNLVAAHPGKCPLLFCFMKPTGERIFVEVHEKFFVTPSRELQKAADDLFGEETYYAKVDTSLPERAPRRWERKPEYAGAEG
jgi:DNA polymerase-3 subunit alpha